MITIYTKLRDYNLEEIRKKIDGILENIYKLEGFDRNFSVYDSSDQDKLLKKVIKELSIDEDVAKKCGYHISKAKNLGLNPEEYRKDNKYERDIDTIYKVYKEYQNQLKNNNALDFDDLLLQTLELFYASPETLRFYQEKFHYIHVDEFQDTNQKQFDIFKSIFMEDDNHKIIVVGDPKQSIYSSIFSSIICVSFDIYQYFFRSSLDEIISHLS